MANEAVKAQIGEKAVEVARMIARRPAGGKSELHRAGCWLTPSLGDEKESATENIPPRLWFLLRRGKGEMVG